MLNALNSITLMIFSTIFQTQPVMIIAHRGASFDAPENTIASVNLAWERGADAVEVDVHLSKDNRIMVIHDSDTKRTTGTKMIIEDNEAVTLRALDAGFNSDRYKGEKIPFVEEVIATVPPGKTLFIEVKTDTVIVPYLSELLRTCSGEIQVVVISFDFDVCLKMKEEIPAVPVYWLHYTLAGAYQLKWITRVKEAGLDGLNFRYKGINKEYVEAVHRAGLKMFAWTVDDPDDAARLVEFGIDGITTNRPGWLFDQLKK
jgi:glycerophosphoryl diester phosphodiesterase